MVILRPCACRRVRQIVYSCVPKPDAKMEHLRRCVERAGGAWREAARLSEPDLARAVRADSVDILVDLTGHTANNRLGVFTMRPAPVQARRPAPVQACLDRWQLPAPVSGLRSAPTRRSCSQRSQNRRSRAVQLLPFY